MRTPTVEWQVAGACNYDCTYCIQSRQYRRGRPQREQLDRAIDAFAELPGVWEIKCSGGEAFAHPLFMQHVVPQLMARTPHRISVLTNFSAERSELLNFAQLTRGRLAVFSASLHLEFTSVEDFAAKAAWFVQTLDTATRFVVNQVVLPGREAEAARCRSVIENHGLRWFPQLYKVDGGVADYQADLVPLIGKRPTPREANTAPSYRGKTCWAGVDYFTVDKDGAAWACRTAKRHGEGALGNIFDGVVTRLASAAPCGYDICPCTVPANRGMIEGIAAGANEWTRYPLEGVVSWNMNTTCNYRCSYCTQRFVDDRGQWATDLPRFLAAFAALPGDWEIKLSGGEPFRHPDFIEAVRALVAARRRVSVVTNFASPLAELVEFCAATRAKPGVLSASLHLEYADPDAFLDKARAVAAQHAGPFVVTCVATRANLPRLAALRTQFLAAGIRFNTQPEKQDRDVIDYDEDEREHLVQLGGHNSTGAIAPTFTGQPCWAGARYFIVDHRGEAFRCYPARRHKAERLGNLLDGTFRVRAEAAPCHYDYCNCSVPFARGMVERI